MQTDADGSININFIIIKEEERGKSGEFLNNSIIMVINVAIGTKGEHTRL